MPLGLSGPCWQLSNGPKKKIEESFLIVLNILISLRIIIDFILKMEMNSY